MREEVKEQAVVPEKDGETKSETESKTDLKIKSLKINSEQEKKLEKLVELIPEILKEVENPEYDEIFGYRINTDKKEHVDVAVRNEILLKFLIANDYDVNAAQKALVATLNWRNKFQPLCAAFQETHDKELEDLGVVTVFDEASGNLKTVTWNLYGKLKNPKALFERVALDGGEASGEEKEGSQFLRWRIGLMERALVLIDFTDPDNHQVSQVHDYNNVSFFRMDPNVKNSTKEIIKIFSDNYPELLHAKFFINVPTIMSWVFAFVKRLGFMSADTIKKFQVLNNGDLSEWFGQKALPKEYNGGKETSVESLTKLNVAAPSHDELPEYAKIILGKLK